MRYLVFALLLPAAAPSVAPAQGVCADVPKFFSRPPKIGEWAEYASETKDKNGFEGMRMAVVGSERRGGKQMYWLQMIIKDKGGKRSVIQSLVPWDPTTLQGQNTEEVVMKVGNQPAMKMSGSMVKSAQTDWRSFCAKSKFLGEELVKVPAGTFPARHYEGPDGETWASMAAPVWHLVKMTTKDGKTMVLSAVGMGAKNEITEKPVDMKAMMANPEAMRKMEEEMKKNEAKEQK